MRVGLSLAELGSGLIGVQRGVVTVAVVVVVVAVYSFLRALP